jgi:raffinose/stachyose/melibiose transport system substrate-binding protein
MHNTTTRKSTMKKPASTRAAAAAAAVLALAVTGCTGAAPDAAGKGSDGLRYLISQPERPSELDAIRSDLEEFEKESGIEVTLDVLPLENLRTVLQTQLRSGEGPDVFNYDTGPGFAGTLAEAGLLYDLTDAYQENDWKIYDFARERVTFDGKISGVPTQLEEVGIFYNKDLFKKHGVQEPKNLSDLQKAAETFTAAGVTPFAVNDKEGWQGGHLFSMALSSRIGPDGMEKLLDGSMPWTSPEVVAALETWSGFAKDGHLPDSPNALTYDNGNALFYKGDAAMNPTGSWLISSLQETVDFEVGFLPFPAEDGPGIFTGGLGGGSFVSADTENPEGAVELLDYLQSEEHGRWQVETIGTIPAFPVDTEGLQVSPLFAQVIEDTAKIAEGSGEFGYNIDVLTTDTFNKTMWDGFQGILTGQKSAGAVARELQTASKQAAEDK